MYLIDIFFDFFCLFLVKNIVLVGVKVGFRMERIVFYREEF